MNTINANQRQNHLPTVHKPVDAITKESNKGPKSVRAPPPPTERRTVKHLASQLEHQIARHSGYVPKNAVPIAFFYYHAKNKSTPHRPWILPKWLCRLGFSSYVEKQKNYHQIEIRRLDESEW